MLSIRKIITTFVFGSLAVAANSSDVYIDQAGSGSTINITQTGSTNSVKGEEAAAATTAATLSGAGQTVDITQTGSTNTAVIDLDSAGANLDYTADGSNNVFDLKVSGGGNSDTTVTVDGDDNRVTVCGTNDGESSASCDTGIASDDIKNTISITGNTNKVNVEVGPLAGDGTTNNITITGATNTVDLTQTSADENHTTLTVDGSSNAITIIQQD